MDSESNDFDRDVADTAAAWVARRDRGLSSGERLAFDMWRAADPRHEMELERIAGTWLALDAVRRAPELEMLANGFLSRAQAGQVRRRRLRAVAATLSAAAAVGVGLFAWSLISARSDAGAPLRATENYRVIASTMQRTLLPDGSVAELNGTSRIELDFTGAERRVRLIDGEAHFVVTRDPDRPFFVSAGPVTVRAVGTAFNVRIENASVEVLVTEGKVKLQSNEPVATQASEASFSDEVPALVQGQRAIINRFAAAAPAGVAIADVNAGEIIDALGWQSTHLVFSNTPLELVVAGFNQYNSHQLKIGDPRLRSRTLTGVFRADNLDGFVRLLRASVDVKAEQRTASETVLVPVR